MKRTDVRIFAAIAISLGVAGLGQAAGVSLASALALGLFAGAGLAALLAQQLRIPLHELRDGVRALLEGRGEKRARPNAVHEIGALAAAIDRDAAQLQLALERARGETQQLEAVLAAMVEGVLVLDREGHVALANPRLRELLDVWHEVEGRRPLEVIRNTEIEAALREAAVGTTVVVRELEEIGPERRTLLMHATGVRGDGRRVGTVAVFHDVSEIRHLEQVRRDFVANASHELRTPLTSIHGYAETLLADAGSDAATRPPLEAIVRNSGRLAMLIEDLLELSRIESRKNPMRPSEVDVAHVCELLAEDAAPRLREAQLELQLETGPNVVAWADRGAVEQVVGNLLDNAIKYTEPGGRITLSARRGPKSVQVEISDTGVGVPAEDQARIFERFYRVDKARSRALGGTGLGLSIVKHLVQAMGGDIRVESASGKGSTFRFSLPLFVDAATNDT